MNKYLADTTVAIDHLRGSKSAKLFLEKHTPYISTVTIAELIQGSRDKSELRVALKLCNNLPEAEMNRKIAHTAIELLTDFHLSQGLFFLDAIIAATAIENKLTLVTGNVKHFSFMKQLHMIPQTKILQITSIQ